MEQILSRLKALLFSLKFYFASGFLLGVGFVEPLFWVLALPGVALFLYTIEQEVSLRRAAFGGFITFTIKVLFAISWFFTTYPIIWIDLSLGRAELPVIGFYWLTVGMAIGAAGALGALALYKLRQYLVGVCLFTVVPIIWLLTELLGSFLFSVFTLGEGSAPNTVFSFGYVGYLLAEHAWLLPLANLGGVFTMTLVAIFFGTLCLWWLKKKDYSEKSKRVMTVSFFLLALSAHFLSYPIQSKVAASKQQTVAIVDTRFGGQEYFALPERESYRREQIIEALAAALATEADYVVLPEDSRYLDPLLSPSQAYALFRFQQGDPQAVVVEAGRVPLVDGAALRASIYDGVKKKAYAVDKQYLVPQGEFMPYFYTKTLALLGASQAAASFGISGFVVGPIIAAFFLSLWAMFEERYRTELNNNN